MTLTVQVPDGAVPDAAREAVRDYIASMARDDLLAMIREECRKIVEEMNPEDWIKTVAEAVQSSALETIDMQIEWLDRDVMSHVEDVIVKEVDKQVAKRLLDVPALVIDAMSNVMIGGVEE